MKKTVRIFAVLSALCLIVCLCACKEEQKDYKITEKRPAEICIPSNTYGSDIYTADLPSLKKMSGMVYQGEDFGKIDDAETAGKCAVKVITDIYGNKAFDGFEPIVVTFNTRADCWIVHGTPKDNLNTGMSFVALRKTTGEPVMVLKNK